MRSLGSSLLRDVSNLVHPPNIYIYIYVYIDTYIHLVFVCSFWPHTMKPRLFTKAKYTLKTLYGERVKGAAGGWWRRQRAKSRGEGSRRACMRRKSVRLGRQRPRYIHIRILRYISILLHDIFLPDIMQPRILETATATLTAMSGIEISMFVVHMLCPDSSLLRDAGHFINQSNS